MKRLRRRFFLRHRNQKINVVNFIYHPSWLSLYWKYLEFNVLVNQSPHYVEILFNWDIIFFFAFISNRVRLKADDPQRWKQTILKRMKADDPGWKQTILGSKQTIPQKADDLSAKADDLLRKSRRSLGQSRRSWAKADDLKGWKRTILFEIFMCKSRRSKELKADDPICNFYV